MNILLPTTTEFVDQVARSMARDRFQREALEVAMAVLGVRIQETDELDARFDKEFDLLWNGKDEESVWNRESYRSDAVAAINKINMLLLTVIP
jgi:hypothetical protein